MTTKKDGEGQGSYVFRVREDTRRYEWKGEGAVDLGLRLADVKVMELVANNRRPNARMFWAQSTNTWTMFAHDLPVPPAGRTYQLWLITRTGQRISAGTFAPDPSGGAVVSAQYPLAPDALQMIAVTEEPAGGVLQPTGEVVIAGQPR